MKKGQGILRKHKENLLLWGSFRHIYMLALGRVVHFFLDRLQAVMDGRYFLLLMLRPTLFKILKASPKSLLNAK